MGEMQLVFDDGEDPVYWTRGKYLPDGRARVLVLHESQAVRLRAAFGPEWLAAYIVDAEADLAKWGVN